MDDGQPERNPFTLPSDEEVFRMRDEERKRRSKEREEQRKLKVWQKTTGGSNVAGSVRLKELIGGDAREGAASIRLRPYHVAPRHEPAGLASQRPLDKDAVVDMPEVAHRF